MITREQLENALNDDTKESFVTKNVDHDLIAINLLPTKEQWFEAVTELEKQAYM